ncbi:MAG: hypothetical protein Q7K42_06560, partial [Candidatus Diapherotrites archaeon]|nr:hypothetical protein [Candidatus Diapherotrites archaeon]
MKRRIQRNSGRLPAIAQRGRLPRNAGSVGPRNNSGNKPRNSGRIEIGESFLQKRPAIIGAGLVGVTVGVAGLSYLFRGGKYRELSKAVKIWKQKKGIGYETISKTKAVIRNIKTGISSDLKEKFIRYAPEQVVALEEIPIRIREFGQRIFDKYELDAILQGVEIRPNSEGGYHVEAYAPFPLSSEFVAKAKNAIKEIEGLFKIVGNELNFETDRNKAQTEEELHRIYDRVFPKHTKRLVEIIHSNEIPVDVNTLYIGMTAGPGVKIMRVANYKFTPDYVQRMEQAIREYMDFQNSAIKEYSAEVEKAVEKIVAKAPEFETVRQTLPLLKELEANFSIMRENGDKAITELSQQKQVLFRQVVNDIALIDSLLVSIPLLFVAGKRFIQNRKKRAEERTRQVQQAVQQPAEKLKMHIEPKVPIQVQQGSPVTSSKLSVPLTSSSSQRIRTLKSRGPERFLEGKNRAKITMRLYEKSQRIGLGRDEFDIYLKIMKGKKVPIETAEELLPKFAVVIEALKRKGIELRSEQGINFLETWANNPGQQDAFLRVLGRHEILAKAERNPNIFGTEQSWLAQVKGKRPKLFEQLSDSESTAYFRLQTRTQELMKRLRSTSPQEQVHIAKTIVEAFIHISGLRATAHK